MKQSRWPRWDLSEVLMVLGAMAIVTGVFLIDRPSALIVAGAILIVFGVLAVRGNDGRAS